MNKANSKKKPDKEEYKTGRNNKLDQINGANKHCELDKKVQKVDSNCVIDK